MIKLIAETAWHHEGDFIFMRDLVTRICENSNADIVKFHITLDLEEYMNKDHDAYKTLKSWMFSETEWEELICIVRENNKEIMLLLNDIKAIEFAKKAIEIKLPMQPGDVPITYADIDDLYEYIGFKPTTSIEDGISKFVDWYKHKPQHED